MDKKVIKAGKYMSLLLRHAPEKEHLDMDKFGWVSIKQLISRLDITFSDLMDIVIADNKQRFSFNDDETKIRANQGHSIDVDVQLEETEPLSILYHGTSTKDLDSIFKTGLKSKSRLYVHLSSDIETATSVGKRHGTPYVLKIDAVQMYKDGFQFYLSKNGVWLTKFIPSKYITL